MERSDSQKIVEGYLGSLFTKNKQAFKQGELIEVGQIFDKQTYMQFLWQINSLSHSSNEIQNCYRILKIEVSKLIEESIKETVEGYQNGEMGTERFILRINELIDTVKNIERMVGRFFCYFDKKEMQCTNFLDETSSELINSQFFDGFLAKYKTEVFRAVKEATKESVFNRPGEGLVKYFNGLSYFLQIKDRKRAKYCEELMKRYLAIVNEEILNILKDLPMSIYDRLQAIYDLNQTITQNSLKIIPLSGIYDYLREKLLELINSTLVEQLRRDFARNDCEGLVALFSADDLTKLRMFVELIKQVSIANLVFFKDPFKNYMIQNEILILEQSHQNSEELVERLIAFFKSCNERIIGVFERDNNLIFSRNKAIEHVMQEGVVFNSEKVPASSIILESLLKCVILRIRAHNGVTDMRQLEQEFEPVVDILSYADSREFFKEFNKFFITRMLDTNHLTDLQYEKGILDIFERKLGETVLQHILSVYNEILQLRNRQTAFNTFRDSHNTKKDVEFNVTQVSHKDIEQQTQYRQSQQFLYFSGIYASYFGLDRANENRKHFISFELGHVELDYTIGGKNYLVATKPVYGLILMKLSDLRPRSVNELSLEIAHQPFATDPEFRLKLKNLLNDVVNKSLVLFNGEKYELNTNFNSDENTIVLGAEGFGSSNKEATGDKESKAEKSLEYESKIMKIIKQVKNMSIREIEEYISNTIPDFSIERCREAVNYLLEREMVLRHYQKTDIIMYK